MTVLHSPTAFDPAPWDGLLAEISRRHHVPGIVAGVLSIDPGTGAERRFVARTGVSNVRTGVESDRDTLCQIGSITKVVTTTMIMQLCEEGRLSLDSRLVDVLPELALDSPHADDVTVRHLVTHTSGIDGDLFTDTGRGDDCIERYVATLTSAESLFAPSTGWSYCNSGFVLAGRIIEVLDGRTWDQSLRARISEPLGISSFLTLPEQVMAHRHQYGHVRAPGTSTWAPAATAMIARSMGPAGLITSTVDDLLSFGAAFLRGGATRDGARLVSEETVAAMTQPQWTLDEAAATMAPRWGLGWMLDDWDGHRVFWHGGTTIGNNAWLQVLPDDGLVLVVFCNGGVAPYAAAEVYGAFAAEFAGAVPTPLVRPSGPSADAVVDDHWLGTYADASTSLTVTRGEDGGGRVTIVNDSGIQPAGEPTPTPLLPTSEPFRFVTRPDALTPWAPVSFTSIDGTPVAYVGIRALPRREEAAA
ncbi:CubicO group peptidase (beta-lactamase class C family) [Microcella alkaliphila]|uniref:CubicO group peptidase (Beta-lactamase class C family) n=1 Tax=Microcella alkaliphila TaxID=279828 RepID=A0A4Q7TZ46_9MICO|nr:serine hydrolase domain-containing protein [Microcella alkaliphila]RZT66451.1 CubicO group peptidase (beta-lactamase class C family) [Microcella alkaliphila]